MFDQLTHEDLIHLSAVRSGPCVSIYIPSMPKKTLQLEFEAQVRRASYLLESYENPTPQKSLLSTLSEFNPGEYLPPMGGGLALFVNKHWRSYFLSAHELPSKAVVGDSFFLEPLLEDLRSAQSYHILVLSGSEIILLRSEGERLAVKQRLRLHQGRQNSHTRGRGVNDTQFKKRSNRLFLKWIEAEISREKNFRESPLYVFSSKALFKVYNSISTHPHPILCPMRAHRVSLHGEALIRLAQLQVQKAIALSRKKSPERKGGGGILPPQELQGQSAGG